jgi:hypothetical protein
MTKIRKIFFLLICSTISVACAEEEYEVFLSGAYVDFYFDLSYPPYTQLRDIYPNAIKVKERELGYEKHGIILVRLSENDFRAYDATCTRNIEQETSALTLSEDRFTAHCPKCGAEYSIQIPGAYEKNGKRRLQRYRLTGGNGRWHVVN